MTTKIIIVGAGSAGLLLALYLLQRQVKYQIEIYDRLVDPRLIPPENSRSFPLSLNIRGFKALSQISGLESAVKSASIMINASISHQPNGKNKVMKRQNPLFCLDRNTFIITLLNTLTQNPHFSQVNLHFNTTFTDVDSVNKIASFTDDKGNIFTKNYDILIGADGGRSRVRKHFLNPENNQVEEKPVYADYKTINLPVDHRLKTNYIHGWRLPDTSTMILVAGENFTNGVITFPKNNHQITNLKTSGEFKEYLKVNFPEIAEIIPEKEAEEFIQRPIGKVLTIKCDRYDHQGNILLIGDAAHAVSPSLGLGCNAAMEDVFIINKLLDENQDNWQEVLPQFTQVRKADVHALVAISESPFPFNKVLFFELIIRQFVAKIQKQPFLFQLLSNTHVGYDEIFQKYKGWIEKVKKSNQKWIKN